jgi:Cu-Zn family superoxide dismutase
LGVSAWSAAAMARPNPSFVSHPAQIAVADTTGIGGGSQISSRRDHVKVLLKDVKGKRVAQVDIEAVRQGGNRVTVHAWDLTPGFHAIHIHAAGVCDPAGAKPFASAGGHFNPTGAAEGMQAGAFPVLLAGANGEAQAQFLDGNFTIRDLVGVKGAAIVIHAGPDNYANIPNRYAVNGVAGPDAETQMTGDAGARFACGVVSSPQVKPSTSPSASMSGM